MRISITDLPPAYQAQVRAQLGLDTPAPTRNQTPETRTPKGPNKTEAAYWAILKAEGMRSIAYEGMTFRLQNGHRYTPDFACITPDGYVLLVEVKGSYRLHSHQRARLAFDQAKVEWPCFGWLWAERSNGSWKKSLTKPKFTQENDNA